MTAGARAGAAAGGGLLTGAAARPSFNQDNIGSNLGG
jgi:hypothetical protein